MKSKPSQKSIRSGEVRGREAGWGQKLRILPRSREVISGLEPRSLGLLWKYEGPGTRAEAKRYKMLSSPSITGSLGNGISCSTAFIALWSTLPVFLKIKINK